jgi:hypothetical protein
MFKVAFQVGVHYVAIAGSKMSVHLSQGILATPAGTETVAALGEVPFEDGLQNIPEGGLYDPISHSGYPQRPHLLATGLGYILPPYGFGAICPFLQTFTGLSDVM